MTLRHGRSTRSPLGPGIDLDQNNKPCDGLSSAYSGEWRKHLEDVMTKLKSLTIAAALLAGGTSLAVAQNGPATGNEPPVAGGGGGNPVLNYGWGALGYWGAPAYWGATGYGGAPVAPGYPSAPGYLAGPRYGTVAPGYAAGPRRVATTRHGHIYMYAPRTK
jgi:hypothetical protein